MSPSPNGRYIAGIENTRNGERMWVVDTTQARVIARHRLPWPPESGLVWLNWRGNRRIDLKYETAEEPHKEITQVVRLIRNIP